MEKLKTFVIDSTNTTGLMVVHRGKALFEYGNVEDNSYVASVRKSILSMLYGPFVENGQVDLDETLAALGVDDIGGLLPIEKRATVRDLLTARSGIYHPASNAGDQSDRAPERGSVEPGSYFLYNNWDFNAAGSILEKAARMNIYDIVNSILAGPLEMQDWKRDIQRKFDDTGKSEHLAYHMWFSTRDMARLGYLMLRDGTWKGEQVLPSDWVRTITTPVTSHEEMLANGTDYFDFGYGYLWWTWGPSYEEEAYRGAFTASGAFGQYITVLPALDLVVAHKTNYDDYRRSTSTELYLKILDRLVQAKARGGKDAGSAAIQCV